MWYLISTPAQTEHTASRWTTTQPKPTVQHQMLIITIRGRTSRCLYSGLRLTKLQQHTLLLLIQPINPPPPQFSLLSVWKKKQTKWGLEQVRLYLKKSIRQTELVWNGREIMRWCGMVTFKHGLPLHPNHWKTLTFCRTITEASNLKGGEWGKKHTHTHDLHGHPDHIQASIASSSCICTYKDTHTAYNHEHTCMHGKNKHRHTKLKTFNKTEMCMQTRWCTHSLSSLPYGCTGQMW